MLDRIIEVIAYFSLPDELPTGDIKEKSEMMS